METELEGALTAPKARRSVKACVSCGVPLCSVCVVCHTPGCAYTELSVYDAITEAKYKHFAAKTQKARGFVNLSERAKLSTPQPYFLVLSEADIDGAVDAAIQKGMWNIFVRPCPVRARHGFEESRAVKYEHYTEGGREKLKAEVRKIFEAANAADEEHSAELILLPFVEAQYNAIITPSRMAIGPNHDGATAGYDSISVPLMGTDFLETKSSELISASGIAPHEDPYFEVIAGGNLLHPMFTQIRAGVRVEPAIGADYVPAPMRVQEIIEAEGDLLEWEKQVKQIKPGTVVVKIGGTLISHYGVHCLYNKVPCFTSRRPSIGELLDTPSVSPTPNPEAVIRGLAVGALIPLDLRGSTVASKDPNMECSLIAMMSILHNAGAMSGEHGFWLGYAASTMMRAGMAGSHGEARHKLANMQNMRSFVYKTALKDFMGARKTLGTAQWMFEKLSWSSSFGGKAWAKCTQSIIDLDLAIQILLKDPTESSVQMVVTQLNNAVNQAHNGGWWLNKFIQQSWFDLASKQSLKSLAIAGFAMHKVKHTQIDETLMKNFLDEWCESAPIVAAPGGRLQIQIKSANVDQTIYNDGFKTNKPNTEELVVTLNSVDLLESLADYTGAMCSGCHAKFSIYADAEAIPVGQICGTPLGPGYKCSGQVGWASEGLLVWKYKTYVSGDSLDDDDSDSSDDWSDEPPDNDSDDDVEVADVPFEVPQGLCVKGDAESYPPLKVNGAAPMLKNVGGLVAMSGHVVEAQGNFNFNMNSKQFNMFHLQFKLSDLKSYQYYSTSVPLNSESKWVSAEALELILKGQETPKLSWSGSGIANYWPFEVKSYNENASLLYQPTLKLYVMLFNQTGVAELVQKI